MSGAAAREVGGRRSEVGSRQSGVGSRTGGTSWKAASSCLPRHRFSVGGSRLSLVRRRKLKTKEGLVRRNRLETAHLCPNEKGYCPVGPCLPFLSGMRLLCELVVIGALVYVGWEKPFHDWLLGNKPAPVASAQPRVQVARVSPPPSRPAWMQDPNHRTVLDTPRPALAHSATSPSKSGSWLFDPNHKSPLDGPHSAQTPH
jgi:hypothetical protein